ncbi:MAG: metallophosphoesterase [Deltaproteobacteria bacterium]|nr:metallophosphoesterase [Deltaproteobacteria bacterium]
MKIGIMADSHDHVQMIERACELFNTEGVEMVIHAGDYIAPFSLHPLNHLLKCDYLGVFGNNDGERLGLQKASEGRLHPPPAEFELGGWKVLVAHEMPILEAVQASGIYRLIVYAHTHIPEVKREGETLVVNPGECGGWLYGRCTVAIARLEAIEAKIVDL